jgi:hypothetical protein
MIASKALDGDDLPLLQSDVDEGERIVHKDLVPLRVGDP